MAQQVFISYSHKDHEFVSRLALDLESRGADVWIDHMDIHAGEKWRQTITEGIKACRVFLLVVSPKSLKSEWAMRELGLAAQYGKPVIFLLYRKTRIPEHLQEKFDSYQHMNFRRGSYEQNLGILVTQLAAHGVAFDDLSPEEIARRKRELLLDKTPPTNWRAVLQRVPGWAFAWALGWLVIWAIVPIAVAFGLYRVMELSEGPDLSQFLLMPVSGLAGGFVGGLLAGLFTMLALRRNAPSIRWKHMSMAIRIWAVAGTVVCLVFFGAFLLSSEGPTESEPVDCTGLSVGECFQESMGQGLSDALSTVCMGVFIVLLGGMLSLFAILIIGLVTGAVAVRRIRRLEPGILGRQAVWVVLGWGLGAILAAASGVAVLALLTD